MKNLKNYILNKPVLFSVILMFSIIFLIDIDLPFAKNQYSNYLTGIVEQGFISILLMLFIYKFDILNASGLKGTLTKKSLLVLWPSIVLLLLNYDTSLSVNTSKPLLILLYVLLYSSTGIFEELLCRGVVLSTLLCKFGTSKKGVYFSVLLSSFLFGIGHFHLKYLFQHNNMLLINDFIQIVYAFCIGVFFAACFVRTKSILCVIILHALVDIVSSVNEIAVIHVKPNISSNLTSLIINVLIQVLLSMIFLLYGLFILRKVNYSKPKPTVQNNSLEAV